MNDFSFFSFLWTRYKVVYDDTVASPELTDDFSIFLLTDDASKFILVPDHPAIGDRYRLM